MQNNVFPSHDPREAIISIMRDIDKGKIPIDSVVIITSGVNDGFRETHYSASIKKGQTSMGILEAGKVHMIRESILASLGE